MRKALAGIFLLLFAIAAAVSAGGCFGGAYRYGFARELDEPSFHHAIDILRDSHIYGFILDYEDLYRKGLTGLINDIDPDGAVFDDDARTAATNTDVIRRDLEHRDCNALWAAVAHYNDSKPLDAVKHSFGVEVARQETALSAEHDKAAWVRYEEAMNLLTWEDNREALRRLHGVLAAERSGP